ncbi:hypothetical protein MCOR16_010601 [Pyricularia oryzae]|nr:hypothetical protein MCOR16_010601 [Pyricularia oryzae]
MTFSNTQLERCSNILVFDADRTLAPQDSGTAMVFGGPLSYTHRAFQQVSVLLESFECFNETYDSICDAVANKIIVYPEITNILSRAARNPRVIPVVVTNGVCQVWEMVLQRIGLQEIPMFGGGRVRDQYVVTPKPKQQS